MSENQFSDVLENDEPQVDQGEPTGPKDLRDAYKKAKQEKAALEAELAKLRAEKTEKELAEKIRSAGLPAGAARFAAKELTEVSDEAVTRWIEDNKSLFGVTTEVQQEVTEAVTSAPSGQASVPSDVQQQIAAVQGVESGNFQPGVHDGYQAKASRTVEGFSNLANPIDVLRSLSELQ